MKRSTLFLLWLGLLGGSMSVQAAEPMDVHVSTRPLQAVFVWALGENASDVGHVELDIQEQLIKHGVAGERSVKLFPKGMTGDAHHILARIRTTGCDALLAVRRTSSIHWEAEESEPLSLHSLIVHRAQLLKPRNSLEANAASPIVVPNISDNEAWQIVEGEAMVFDVKSGQLMWRGNTQIKSAKDLPQAEYLQLVAEKVVHELETAGLVPPVKK